MIDPPCGCDEDPVAALVALFVDEFQGAHLAAGQKPARRPVFLRMHGAAHGRLEVAADLPAELRVGVLAQQAAYPVWVRFSSDVQDRVPDRRGTVGIGIKLFDVAGPKLLAPDEDAPTHDFVLQNHDRFFVDTARDMCEFTCLALAGRDQEWLDAHPITGTVLAEMEKDVDSVLATPFWSVLPSRFGAGRHVKYKLEPEHVPPPDGPPDKDDPFFLRADLRERLKKGEARWRFLVQLALDDERTPLDRATERWSEEASAPIHVATLILPAQDVDGRGQMAYGENLAFNPWHALAEHEPVGSIAVARRAVYQASAAARRNTNGVPLAEPEVPRPPELRPGVGYPAAADDVIVRAAIHPAIGIARVGNSEAYFIGPEVPEPPRPAPGDRHDAAGALKRQAARFRIYGYNAAGQVVRELTADGAQIRWSVHVANSKAAWFQWVDKPLDIPEAAGVSAARRNADVTGDAARAALVIDGGKRTIEGAGAGGGEAHRFAGTFLGREVYLGELRTDGRGRLLFLGGRGVSSSPNNVPVYDPDEPFSFANARGWHDDTSDGPVTATVVIDGRAIPVEPAWVATAPPDYAPGTIGVRTLHDLLHDVYVTAGWIEAPPVPPTVSFERDVRPLLMRLADLQWVNKGFAAEFGRGAPHDFSDREYLQRLGTPPVSRDVDPWNELRRLVLNHFRDPRATERPTGEDSRLPWPWIYGDGSFVDQVNPREHAAVTRAQYQTLQAWAAGSFVRGTPPRAVPSIGAVPLADQPAMLDRAALHHCLADAFHPGCELTWPLRHLSMYRRPFRIRHRAANEAPPTLGATLDPTTALAPGGPLGAQGPGDLTRWMALPWQVDTAGCQSGYDRKYDPYLPSFWPARVPNHVLSEQDYQTVVDPSRPREERVAAFQRREHWIHRVSTKPLAQLEGMVTRFGDMAIVEMRAGVENDADLPPRIGVGSPIRSSAAEPAMEPVGFTAAAEGALAELAADVLTDDDRNARQAGWDSAADHEEALRIMRMPRR